MFHQTGDINLYNFFLFLEKLIQSSSVWPRHAKRVFGHMRTPSAQSVQGGHCQQRKPFDITEYFNEEQMAGCDFTHEQYDVNPYILHIIEGFVCVEVLRPSQPNGVMSSAVSFPNHTLLGRFSPLSG